MGATESFSIQRLSKGQENVPSVTRLLGVKMGFPFPQTGIPSDGSLSHFPTSFWWGGGLILSRVCYLDGFSRPSFSFALWVPLLSKNLARAGEGKEESLLRPLLRLLPRPLVLHITLLKPNDAIPYLQHWGLCSFALEGDNCGGRVRKASFRT